MRAILALIACILAMTGCSGRSDSGGSKKDGGAASQEWEAGKGEQKTPAELDNTIEEGKDVHSPDSQMESTHEIENAIPEINPDQAREAINEILSELDLYAYTVLESYYQDVLAVGDDKQLELNDNEIIRASGLCDSVLKGDEFTIDDEFSGSFIDEESLNEMCMDLFGKSANLRALNTEGNVSCDVVKYDGKPIVRYYLLETENDSIVIKNDIDVSGDNYTATQYRYHGYWGLASYEKNNFKLRYDFKRNPDSKYGISISGIYIERTDDEGLWNGTSQGDNADYDNVSDFYGIWCGADKSMEGADKIAANLREKGLDARVFLTTDWENLNRDPYFVVTAGVYTSKEEAQMMLDVVKNSGFPDAYIKHSGAYIGKAS